MRPDLHGDDCVPSRRAAMAVAALTAHLDTGAVLDPGRDGDFHGSPARELHALSRAICRFQKIDREAIGLIFAASAENAPACILDALEKFREHIVCRIVCGGGWRRGFLEGRLPPRELAQAFRLEAAPRGLVLELIIRGRHFLEARMGFGWTAAR